MFKNFLNMDFLTIFLILGFSMKLAMRKRARDTHIPYLWLTVFCTVGLVAAVNLEYWAQEDPDRIFWRTLFNVIGYSLRPVASLMPSLTARVKDSLMPLATASVSFSL